jgi:hypothetical protein
MRLPSSSAGMGRRQREEIVRARRFRRCIVASLGIVALAPILLLGPSLAWRSSRAHLALSESATAALADDFDAIVVPGGGLMADGEPPPWVVARLDKCLELWTLNPGARVVVLSRGTPHKPPPLDADGRPIDEAAVSADYLRARGVPSEQLLQDTWSLDTIGNAFFLRLMHLEPRGCGAATLAVARAVARAAARPAALPGPVLGLACGYRCTRGSALGRTRGDWRSD